MTALAYVQSALTYPMRLMPRQPPPPRLIKRNRVPGTSAVLIVGGTDGSGTRAVVKVLQDLGVPMVAEDAGTFDVHANDFGGWPSVVDPVLNYSHSISADVDVYPTNISSTVLRKLGKILAKAFRDSGNYKSRSAYSGGVLPIQKGRESGKVIFGIKAPISIVLLPMLAEVIPRFM